MNRYKSCADLKNAAKIKLEGHYSLCINVLLLVVMTNYFANSLINLLVPGTDITSTILALLLSIIVSILIAMLDTGLAYFFLSLACGSPCEKHHIFHGFRNEAEKSFKISCAHVFLNLVCLTPFQYLGILFIQSRDLRYLTYTVIALAIGLIIYIPLDILLSQTYFILVDFPKYSALDALRTSCKIMKKHALRFFWLEITFLPLMLLGVLSFFIGFLWIVPYMKATYAGFYLDIMKPASDNNTK